MKIEEILKEIMICIEHNDEISYYLDNENLQALLNYIADLQRKEYNNSKAIEYVEKSKLNQLDTYCKYLYIDFDTEKIEHLDELLNILKGE